MNRNSPALSIALGPLLLCLAACTQVKPTGDENAGFYVNATGQGGASGYLPTGWGWTSASKVEIRIWHEPTGPGAASDQWKTLFVETVGPDGMFGFNSGAPFYPVQRTICGTPENNQTILFVAKSLTTGRAITRQVPAHLYFTFRPCP
jgi:hypothetical protein